MSPGRDLHGARHSYSHREGSSQNDQECSWHSQGGVCLSGHIAGHSQLREERSQHNSEGRWELITMAPSLFWSRMPSLLLSLTLSSHDHQPGAEAAGLGAKMAQVFPTTHRLVEVREEVFEKLMTQS